MATIESRWISSKGGTIERSLRFGAMRMSFIITYYSQDTDYPLPFGLKHFERLILTVLRTLQPESRTKSELLDKFQRISW